MDESDFWNHLEYIVSGAMQQWESLQRHCLWCDGFLPEEYVFDVPSPFVKGQAWIGYGMKTQEKWDFTLDLKRRTTRCEDIVWALLLPEQEDTGWLHVDLENKQLRICLCSSPLSKAIQQHKDARVERTVRACLDESFEECLDLAKKTQDPVEILGPGVSHDRFMILLLWLIRKWGQPDYPGDMDWRAVLGFMDGMLALWDFDYYAITLRYDNDGVWLQWYQPELICCWLQVSDSPMPRN